MLERFQPLQHRDVRVVQVQGAEVALRGRIVVDHFQSIVAKVPLLAIDLAIGNFDGDAVVARAREHGVERENAKRTAFGSGIQRRFAHRAPCRRIDYLSAGACASASRIFTRRLATVRSEYSYSGAARSPTDCAEEIDDNIPRED